MALTYGEVDLPLPTSEILNWIEDNISYNDIPIFTYRSTPGKNLGGLTIPTGFYPMKRVRLNRLYWYTGASRWGYCHLVCDTEKLEEIRKAAYGEDCTEMNKLELTIDDGDNFISPEMYLAYQTPFSGIRKVNGLWMITLVDPRYYWWQIPTPDFGITEETEWDDLYTKIEEALEVDVDSEFVDIAYLQPGPSLNLRWQVLPPVFDSIAYNCGQRVVYGFDGKVEVLNFDSSAVTFEDNMSLNAPKRAGDMRYPDEM